MNHALVFLGIERDRFNAQIDPIKRAAALKEVRREAAHTFGGYTLANVEGGWVDPHGRLIEEGSIRLDLIASDRWNVRSFAEYAGRALNQSSVLIVYGGRGEFVAIDYNRDVSDSTPARAAVTPEAVPA